MSERQLKLGAILAGVGTTQNAWRAPDVPGDASIDINWYVAQARKAEAAKFDLVFIVDSPYITPDSAPHYLNRLEPLTLLSAVATATSRRNEADATASRSTTVVTSTFLTRRGLFRTEYSHDTLRGNLGLPIPANRYSVTPTNAAAALPPSQTVAA
jgi:hypothetical protein